MLAALLTNPSTRIPDAVVAPPADEDGYEGPSLSLRIHRDDEEILTIIAALVSRGLL